MLRYHLNVLRCRTQMLFLRWQMFLFHRRMLRLHKQMIRLNAPAPRWTALPPVSIADTTPTIVVNGRKLHRPVQATNHRVTRATAVH